MQSCILQMYYGPTSEKINLYEAILDFQNRERRFGKTSEQIKKEAIINR